MRDPRAQAPALPAAPPPEAGPAPGPVRSRIPARAALALLLVGGALGFGLAELLQAQQERAAERAAAEALDLRLEPGAELFASTQQDEGDEVGLSRQLRLRNAGPRAVQLLGAELVGGAMASPALDRRAPAGELVDLELSTRLHCTAGTQPQVAPPGSVLRVRARTGAGERAVDVALPERVLADLQDTGGRLCGYVPVSQALVAVVDSELVRGEQLLLRISLNSATASRLRLVGVDLGVPGLRASLGAGGRPARLPLVLARPALAGPLLDGGFGEPLRLDVDLDVTDCQALREAVQPAPPHDPQPLLLLGYDVEGAGERGSAALGDQGGLSQLLTSACG